MANTAPPEDESHKLAAEVRPLVERLHADLDSLSYYQLLGVGRDASAQAIQQAFYRRAVQLHPDRHFNLTDSDLKVRIREVYKRIAEGYRVLSAPPLRRTYDAGLRRGEVRIRQRAFDQEPAESQPAASGRSSPIPQIYDTSAKELYEEASAKLKEHEFAAAIELLQKALNLEPDSDMIARRLEDARRLQRLWEGSGL